MIPATGQLSPTMEVLGKVKDKDGEAAMSAIVGAIREMEVARAIVRIKEVAEGALVVLGPTRPGIVDGHYISGSLSPGA